MLTPEDIPKSCCTWSISILPQNAGERRTAPSLSSMTTFIQVHSVFWRSLEPLNRFTDVTSTVKISYDHNPDYDQLMELWSWFIES